jgi:hypothetical protein
VVPEGVVGIGVDVEVVAVPVGVKEEVAVKVGVEPGTVVAVGKGVTPTCTLFLPC